MRTASRWGLVAAGLLVGLLAGEIVLVICGIPRGSNQVRHFSRWAQEDPVLGWRNRPGTWPVDLESRPMTLLPDGSRQTVPKASGATNVVVMAGCSFMQGYGVRDEETVASQLQRQFPGTRLVNRATAGYGTVQVCLALRQWLEQSPSPPACVIYGFLDHHELRNVADMEWIRGLRSYSRGHLVPPHVWLDGRGQWQWRPYESRNLLGLARASRLAHLVEDAQMSRVFAGRSGQMTAATEFALRALRDLCRQHHAELVVVHLFGSAEKTAHYERFCREEKIHFLNARPDINWQEMRWWIHQGDETSHPNERVHKLWADSIAAFLQQHGLR